MLIQKFSILIIIIEENRTKMSLTIIKNIWTAQYIYIYIFVYIQNTYIHKYYHTSALINIIRTTMQKLNEKKTLLLIRK